MPRTSSAEEKPRKRVARKRATTTRSRAPRKTTAKKAVPKKTARKNPRQSVVPEKKVDTVSSETANSTRKAPTSIARDRQLSKLKRNQMTVVASILLAGVGASAAVGFTDQGKIDVNEAIEARNERMQSGQAREGETQRIVVPVQNNAANQLPDGGLVGRGDVKTSPPPVPEVVSTTGSTTATSTDSTASTTATSTDSDDESIENDGEVVEESDSDDDAVVPENEVTDEATVE